jgi:hypothetical protein
MTVLDSSQRFASPFWLNMLTLNGCNVAIRPLFYPHQMKIISGCPEATGILVPLRVRYPYGPYHIRTYSTYHLTIAQRDMLLFGLAYGDMVIDFGNLSANSSQVSDFLDIRQWGNVRLGIRTWTRQREPQARIQQQWKRGSARC